MSIAIKTGPKDPHFSSKEFIYPGDRAGNNDVSYLYNQQWRIEPLISQQTSDEVSWNYYVIE